MTQKFNPPAVSEKEMRQDISPEKRRKEREIGCIVLAAIASIMFAVYTESPAVLVGTIATMGVIILVIVEARDAIIESIENARQKQKK